MKHLSTHPGWSTTSFGGSTDTSPMELEALGTHLSHCSAVHGRLFAARCEAERMNAYVSTRLITRLLVAVLLAVNIGSLVP